MALTRSKKEELIAHYAEGLAAAPHAFLVGFQGLSVPAATRLRSRIREQGGSYEVVKNTLALRAIEGKGLAGLKEQFQGPIAVAYIGDNPVALAKALTEFRKEVPAIEFKGALIDGQTIAAGQVEEIAHMPGREELIARLLFLLQSPITRLARSLAAIPQQLVVALNQIAEKRAASS